MSSNLKIIIQEFEKELWLFIDKNLPDDRLNYWEEQLRNHPELRKMLEETKNVLSIYNENPASDIDESVYQNILNVVSNKKNVFQRLIGLVKLRGTAGKQPNTIKIAFGGALSAAAIVMLLITEKPNPIKDISSDLLDWDAEKITNQIDEMGLSIKMVKDEEFEKHLMKKFMEDKWRRDIYSIDKNIKELQNEIKEASL